MRLLKNTLAGYTGYWWMRSAFHCDSNVIGEIYNDGLASVSVITDTHDGVPAVCRI